MTAYWWYLLKVSICIIAFYSFYIVLLRNCTFFLLNRLYLLLGLFLSFVIPILNFSIFKSQSNNGLSNIIYPFLIEPEYEFFQTQNLSDHVTTINYSMILPIIYFTGISVLFFKLLFSIIRILQIRNHSETYQLGKNKVVKVGSHLPFSFFNMIFLPKDENSQMIIEHEIAHTRQFHWFDLVLTEIVSILLWFNPFVIFYKNSLKLQHEYLADTNVVKDKSQIEEYLNCMLKHIQVAGYSGIINHFYCKTIKKRIVMITKNKTSNKYLAVYLLIIPVVCFMLLAFSSSKAELVKNSEFMQDTTVIDVTVLNAPSIYPVDSKKIKNISEFGERTNPQTKVKVPHPGMDFAIAEGEDVVSTAGGVVVDAKFDSGRGNYVVIRHDEIYSTSYSHLKSILVQVGEKLKQGQVIGYVGNTGISTGPHLHYEVLRDGKNVNPKDYLPK